MMRTDNRSGAMHMLVRRLSARSQIEPAAAEAILRLPVEFVTVRPHTDFVHAGQKVDNSCLIADGLVARFQQLRDGGRQIVSLHIPGDFVDLHSFMLPRAPTPLQALCTSTIIKIQHAAIRALIERHPSVAMALWRESVVDVGIVSQTVVKLGRLDARARVAHLLCEMAMRFQAIDALQHAGYRFPVTQEQLADSLGLTPVHVNRMLRQLREDKLVAVASNRVDILDWNGLKEAGDFDPAYLCLPSIVDAAQGMQRSA